MTEPLRDTETIRAALEEGGRFDSSLTFREAVAALDRLKLSDEGFRAARERVVALETALRETKAEIEKQRDEAIKFYGDCREEGSWPEAAIHDARASAYSKALGLLDRAALSVSPAPRKTNA